MTDHPPGSGPPERPPYGAQPPPLYGVGAPVPPPSSYDQPGGGAYVVSGNSGGAIALIVVSALSLFTCVLTLPGVIGLVLGIIAVAKNKDDPDGTRQLTRVGWIAYVIAFAVCLVTFVAAVIVLWHVGSVHYGTTIDARALSGT